MKWQKSSHFGPTSMITKTSISPTSSPNNSTTSTSSFSFQLLSPNHHPGATRRPKRGEEEMVPHEQTINMGVGSSSASTTTSSTTTTSYVNNGHKSRWNPTPEQLLILEDIYGRVRTPTAYQIRQIASHLQMFGKIEGKNVFYWFQNQKARERQKRRRDEDNNGMRRTDQEGDHQDTKDLESASNITKNKQGLHPVHGKAAKAENKTHGRLQCKERELLEQTKRNLVSHDTWQNGVCPSSTHSPPIFHSSRSNIQANGKCHPFNREIQTLQLFPLRKENNDEDYEDSKEARKVPITTINTNFSPSQFFEFLPLKNRE